MALITKRAITARQFHTPIDCCPWQAGGVLRVEIMTCEGLLTQGLIRRGGESQIALCRRISARIGNAVLCNIKRPWLHGCIKVTKKCALQNFCLMLHNELC